MVISEQEKNRILNLHINSININGSLITEEVYGKGQKGKKIKEIQKLLGNVTVDGRFGPETEKAVRQFQKSSGLKSDGYVGSETLKLYKEKHQKVELLMITKRHLPLGKTIRQIGKNIFQVEMKVIFLENG